MSSEVNQDRTGGRRSRIFVLMALFMLSADADAAQVLILNSYHHGFEWTDDIVRGAGDVLRSTKQKISIHTEYMDTRRHDGRQFLDTLAAFYKVKFANVRFNAIVASDDNAVNFLFQHHDELFAGVPVIFCGVNEYRGSSDYLKQYPEARKWLTGVLETVDV